MEFRTITAPFTEEVLKSLKVGEIVNVSGKIYAARDAVLPKIVKMIESGEIENSEIDLQGGVMYLDSVVSGMLKGLNQQVHSLWFAVADSAVRIGLIYLLLPRFGLTGFLYVMLVSNLLTATLSTARLLTVSHTPMNWGRWVIRPFFAAAVAGCCVWLFNRLLPTTAGLFSVLPQGLVFIAVYCFLLPLLGCFTRAEWQELTAKKTAVG